MNESTEVSASNNSNIINCCTRSVRCVAKHVLCFVLPVSLVISICFNGHTYPIILWLVYNGYYYSDQLMFQVVVGLNVQ